MYFLYNDIDSLIAQGCALSLKENVVGEKGKKKSDWCEFLQTLLQLTKRVIGNKNDNFFACKN